jgi:hypothetical protein
MEKVGSGALECLGRYATLDACLVGLDCGVEVCSVCLHPLIGPPL